jgi:hypothetical protein
MTEGGIGAQYQELIIWSRDIGSTKFRFQTRLLFVWACNLAEIFPSQRITMFALKSSFYRPFDSVSCGSQTRFLSAKSHEPVRHGILGGSSMLSKVQ